MGTTRTLGPRAGRRWARVLPAALLFALLLPASAGAVSAGLADSIARLIPDGPVTVDILTPQYSPRMEQIANKIDAARRANPRFFQAWIARHPGGAPPWNPVFGVTRIEYDEYIREGRIAAFVVSSRARLTFERAGRARRWTLRGWGKLAPLEGLVLDIDGGRVVSRRAGTLPFFGVSAPDDAGVQLKWRWFAAWKASHVMGDPVKGGQALQASFHVGPLDDGRTTGMYWVMRRFNGGRKLADEFLLVRFQPAGARTAPAKPAR
jgi:hypothetical protein